MSSDSSGSTSRVVIVGSGVFGVSTALALRRRYLTHHLTSPHLPHLYSSIILIDQSPITPSPSAASSDLNRIVRADYASDLLYTHLALRSIQRWHQLNVQWNETVYHQTGLLLLTSRPLEQEPYECDSFNTMQREGVEVTRLTGQGLKERFPLFGESGHYVDGYFNPTAGWVDNGRATELLIRDARQLGITIVNGAEVKAIEGTQGRATHVVTRDDRHEADMFVFCCGAWTPTLFPYTASLLRCSPQPVVYLQPPPALLPSFTPSTFPVVAAALSSSGYYLFPPSTRSLSPLTSPLIKVAHHGPGLTSPLTPSPSPLNPTLISTLLTHIHSTLPFLSSLPLAHTRTCFYCDADDGDFLVDFHPDFSNALICSGDSGHAFKFAPVLGEVVVGILTDDAEYKEMKQRFRWREGGKARKLDGCRSFLALDSVGMQNN